MWQMWIWEKVALRGIGHLNVNSYTMSIVQAHISLWCADHKDIVKRFWMDK